MESRPCRRLVRLREEPAERKCDLRVRTLAEVAKKTKLSLAGVRYHETRALLKFSRLMFDEDLKRMLAETE